MPGRACLPISALLGFVSSGQGLDEAELQFVAENLTTLTIKFKFWENILGKDHITWLSKGEQQMLPFMKDHFQFNGIVGTVQGLLPFLQTDFLDRGLLNKILHRSVECLSFRTCEYQINNMVIDEMTEISNETVYTQIRDFTKHFLDASETDLILQSFRATTEEHLKCLLRILAHLSNAKEFTPMKIRQLLDPHMSRAVQNASYAVFLEMMTVNSIVRNLESVIQKWGENGFLSPKSFSVDHVRFLITFPILNPTTCSMQLLRYLEKQRLQGKINVLDDNGIDKFLEEHISFNFDLIENVLRMEKLYPNQEFISIMFSVGQIECSSLSDCCTTIRSVYQGTKDMLEGRLQELKEMDQTQKFVVLEQTGLNRILTPRLPDWRLN